MNYDVNALCDQYPFNARHSDSEIEGTDICEIGRSFLGSVLSQSYVGVYFLEHYIEANEFQYVAEFGSHAGAISLYLANAAAVSQRFYFDTYELYPQWSWYAGSNEHEWEVSDYYGWTGWKGCGPWFEQLAQISPFINFYHADALSSDSIDHVSSNILDKKTFLFCDGGNKVEEFNTYAPLIKTGDRIAVHDWDTEIFENQIQDVCDEHSLEPDGHWAEHHYKLGTGIMPFVKV